MSKVDQAYNRLESWSVTLNNHLRDHRKEINNTLEGKIPLPKGCTSRAAAARLAMGQMLQDGDEIAHAMKNLEQAISEEGSQPSEAESES